MANPTEKILFYLATVEDNVDEKGGGRIRARIPTIDYTFGETLRIEDVPYAFPILPKHLHVVPKIGDTVLVMLQQLGNTKGQRFYIGPLISQPYYMDSEPGITHVQSVFDGGSVIAPKPAPSLDPLNRGTLPKESDIAIEGRGNTDIVLKENEIRLRCGYKDDPKTVPYQNRLHRNEHKDQSYIQLKFDKKNRNNKDKVKAYASAVNIVADRINLLSHDSADYFDLNDPENLITDDTMNKVLKDAHPVVYGDVLIEYLKKLISVFMNHTHPFPMDPPCIDEAQMAQINPSQLDSMVSQSIRVN